MVFSNLRNGWIQNKGEEKFRLNDQPTNFDGFRF